jgi:replicative DNA helicase
MEEPISLVVVDYIQLMSSKGKFGNRHLEISHISKLLNFLAKDLDCPVMVLSQTNKDKMLKESGDIENNADNVWILEKPGGPQSLYVKVTATKGKDSGTWAEWLKFNAGKMSFHDCTESEIEEANGEVAAEQIRKKNDGWKWNT